MLLEPTKDVVNGVERLRFDRRFDLCLIGRKGGGLPLSPCEARLRSIHAGCSAVQDQIEKMDTGSSPGSPFT